MTQYMGMEETKKESEKLFCKLNTAEPYNKSIHSSQPE